MALIKCPECGKEVSDKAVSCPVCGYPIASEQNKGKIRIKLAMYGGIGGTQSVTITGGSEILGAVIVDRLLSSKSENARILRSSMH